MSTQARVALTPRQAEVLERLLLGEGQPEIARALGLSTARVDHILRVLRGMHGVQTTLALACLVWRQRCEALEAKLNRSQAALAGFERRSGRDRRES